MYFQWEDHGSGKTITKLPGHATACADMLDNEHKAASGRAGLVAKLYDEDDARMMDNACCCYICESAFGTLSF